MACARACSAKSSSMSLDTLRTSKMRSALTVLGVVIGITSIVGMTSLIRGFDESLRDSIRAARPEYRIRAEVQRAQLRRRAKSSSRWRSGPTSPARTRARSSANARRSALVDVWLGGGGNVASRVYYGREKTKQIAVLGATENFAAVNFIKIELGRLFTPARSSTGAGRRARPELPTSRSSRTSIRSARRCESAPTSSPSSACSASARARAASAARTISS